MEARTGKTAEPLPSAQSGRRMPTGDVFGSSYPAARYDGGGVHDTWNTDHVEEDAVQGGEEEELHDEEDEEPYGTGDEDGDTRDSEFEEDEDEEPPEFGDGEATGKEDSVPAALDFLLFIGQPARPRFASVENTAAFMRVVTAAVAEADQDGGGSEILVHYRYTRFWRALNWGHGHVTVRSGPKLHRVRFPLASPSLADPASSLRLAGTALEDLIYSAHSREQLQALWSSLVAAAPVTVPPGTTRVEVTVDVGILRRGDHTPERVAHMLKALPAVARKADGWPGLHDDGVRPAKRRRFAAAEECAICCAVLERGLAAWPRCSHVFHGECLEQLLVRGDQRCPLCRSELRVVIASSS